jgi:hypothetical protein
MLHFGSRTYRHQLRFRRRPDVPPLLGLLRLHQLAVVPEDLLLTRIAAKVPAPAERRPSPLPSSRHAEVARGSRQSRDALFRGFNGADQGLLLVSWPSRLYAWPSEQASCRAATSTGNTRTGAAYLSRGVVRFVNSQG